MEKVQEEKIATTRTSLLDLVRVVVEGEPFATNNQKRIKELRDRLKGWDKSGGLGPYHDDFDLLELLSELVTLFKGLEDLAKIEFMGPLLRAITVDKKLIEAEIKNIVTKVHTYSGYDIPLLIVGETGTGKELIAHEIHSMSHRSKNKFLPVNCAAISENLLESELFGHEKGAFTGATVKRIGILEEANEGTVFLDEIDKAGEPLQGRLLRTIEQGEIKPIGSNKPRSIDVRFLAATQPGNLENILSDLTWRLGYPRMIRLSNLNELLRKTQLWFPNPVIRNSLKEAMRKIKVEETITISHEANSILVNHGKYKGNYRELESILTDAIISATNDGRTEIQEKDLMILNEINALLEPIEAKEMEQQTLPLDILKEAEDCKLKDIIPYADKLKKLIVKHKLNSINRSGGNIKSQLRSEGVPSKEYQNYWKKFRNIGRGLS
jgi:DNA-binding NtrC family response regulator